MNKQFGYKKTLTFMQNFTWKIKQDEIYRSLFEFYTFGRHLTFLKPIKRYFKRRVWKGGGENLDNGCLYNNEKPLLDIHGDLDQIQ